MTNEAHSPAFNLDLLQLAARHSAVVEFRYSKGKDRSNIEQRRLIPAVVHEGRVVGHDPDREGISSYRLDRIMGLVSTSV